MGLGNLAMLTQLPDAVKAFLKLSVWQKVTLGAYTLGSAAATYAATNDWRAAAVVGAGFFVAHVHGQMQASPAQAETVAQANAIIRQQQAALAAQVPYRDPMATVDAIIKESK